MSPETRIDQPGRPGGPRQTATRRSLAHQVTDYIRSQIYRGVLRGGERVPQAAIAEEFAVSRLPVREALIALESEGLIDSVPHKGAFVVPIRREDIEDHYRVFGLVQGWAARRACTRITAPTIARLHELVETMDAEGPEEDKHDLNWEFHALINQTGGSRRLLFIMRQLSSNLPREVYSAAPAASPEAQRGHRELLAALEAGDGDRADLVARDHLQAESDFIVAKLKQDRVLSED